MGERYRSPRLQVNRETVRELGDVDMREAAGGYPPSYSNCCPPHLPTIPIPNCLVFSGGRLCGA